LRHLRHLSARSSSENTRSPALTILAVLDAIDTIWLEMRALSLTTAGEAMKPIARRKIGKSAVEAVAETTAMPRGPLPCAVSDALPRPLRQVLPEISGRNKYRDRNNNRPRGRDRRRRSANTRLLRALR